MKHKIALIIAVLALSIIVLTNNFASSSLVQTQIITSSGQVSTYQEEHTDGTQIIGVNGSPIVWRSIGLGYSLNSTNYQASWAAYLPELKTEQINTVRLAFQFPNSSGTVFGSHDALACDVLNYTTLNWVLNFLWQNNITAILDLHNYGDMIGDFGSIKMTNDWLALTSYYKADYRIAAFELFNEPSSATWAASFSQKGNANLLKAQVASYYQNLTLAIRNVDPNRLVIWDAEPFLPPLQEITQYFVPNVAFTFHVWWGKDNNATAVPFTVFPSIQTFADETVGKLQYYEQTYNVPCWLGEFGSYQPFDDSNPEYLLVNATLQTCDSTGIGWSLWEADGQYKGDYLALFSHIIGTQQTIVVPLPSLIPYVASEHDLSIWGPYMMEVWFNEGSVTLNPGITVEVVVTYDLSNGTYYIKNTYTLTITQQTTITTIGDNVDTYIFPVSTFETSIASS